MTNAANVMCVRNVNISTFAYDLVVVAGGDVTVDGSCYLTSSKIYMMIINTLNFTFVNDSEISDEGSVEAQLIPEAFVGLVNCGQTFWGNLQISQVHATGPIVKWQSDTNLINGETGLPYPCKHLFMTPFMLTNPASPGVIEATGPAASLGVITLDHAQLKNNTPVLTTASPTGCRVMVRPENTIESATIAMTDANHTVNRDIWLRNHLIEFTGALTANRTVTIPSAEIGPRAINNLTTGGFTLNVIASGSGAAAIQVTPSGVPVRILSNGVDAKRC
jgi:hypothetical protein